MAKFNENFKFEHMINSAETYRMDLKWETNAGAEIIHWGRKWKSKTS